MGGLGRQGGTAGIQRTAPAVGNPANEIADSRAPMPVEVHQPDPSPLTLARRVLDPVLSPLSTTAIVFIFSVFILLQKDDLRDRLIRLFGSGDLHRTTATLDDAGQRLSRYFLAQLGVNVGFGCVIGTGLYFIGLPSPVLWGVIGGLLRFVPYIGSFLAAGLPIALAAAVDPGWSMVAKTAGLFVVAEGITGQIIEPMLYGRSTGSVAVCCRSCRDLLDLALGTGRTDPVDPINPLSGGDGKAHQTARIPRRNAGRQTRVDPRRGLLSAHAGGRPG